jgi:hypothetical protein
MYGEECWYPLIDLANRTILTESLCIVVFMIIPVLGGIPGNLIVIAVYRKHKKKTNAVLFKGYQHSSPYMHVLVVVFNVYILENKQK